MGTEEHNHEADSEKPNASGTGQVESNGVWKGVGKAMLVILSLGGVALGLYILSLPYQYGYSEGYESRHGDLAKEKLAEIPNIEMTAETKIKGINSEADKSVTTIRKPLENLEAERKQLEKRIRQAGNRISSRRFADDEGNGELADDSMALERAIVNISGQCKRIRLLHATFGKSQFMSSSIRKSSAKLKELREAHKEIMDDMVTARGLH